MAEKIDRRTFLKKSAIAGASSFIGLNMLSGCAKNTKSYADIVVALGDDYFTNTLQAVEALGGIERFVPEGSRVAILANPQRNNPGTYTKPEIVRAAIRMCSEAGAREVNCVSWLPSQNWENTGIRGVLEEEGAGLIVVDMKDESEFEPVPVPRGVALKEARIMKRFLDHDILIDIPITKDHAGNRFTGSMKNLMGLNSPVSNRTFHREGWQTDIDAITHLEQCIADLNTVLAPALCLVDATEFITTNGPFGPGDLLKPREVVAGTDRIAIDSYCCTLLGLAGSEIIHVRKGHEHGLGELDLANVHIEKLTVQDRSSRRS